jgi:hypothetical protein
MLNRRAAVPAELIALMTDDIEVFILRWSLKIRSHGFKVLIPVQGVPSANPVLRSRS